MNRPGDMPGVIIGAGADVDDLGWGVQQRPLDALAGVPVDPVAVAEQLGLLPGVHREVTRVREPADQRPLVDPDVLVAEHVAEGEVVAGREGVSAAVGDDPVVGADAGRLEQGAELTGWPPRAVGRKEVGHRDRDRVRDVTDLRICQILTEVPVGAEGGDDDGLRVYAGCQDVVGGGDEAGVPRARREVAGSDRRDLGGGLPPALVHARKPPSRTLRRRKPCFSSV